MATTFVIILFVLGYAAIAFEHSIHINKAASALITGVLCWTLNILQANDIHLVEGDLMHHLSEISSILFFLLGAMTIVEIVDAHHGFKIITNRITTKNQVKLLWIIATVTFFLSAVLDNLTTSIVMVSLLRKLVHNRNQRMFFAGIVIIAANAGGAFSPIGDVTTTMLWIGGQITTVHIIKTLFLPSVICIVLPLVYLSFKLKGDVDRGGHFDHDIAMKSEKIKGSITIFFVGIGGLIFVPIFKTVTHLPPFMGMMLSLGVIWVVSELIHRKKTEEEKRPFTAIHALTKIDVSSVLFFLGVLLAVASLQSMGVLKMLAEGLQSSLGNENVIVVSIGLLSAIVDNVPLVAGAMKMYELGQYIPGLSFPADHQFWGFLAYCAGTGGSVLIIGSAAGVAVMGMEKIDFIWYLKKISLLALLGYFGGVLAYLLTINLF